MYIIANILLGLASVLDSVLFIYMLIVFGAVIISWVNADPHNPIVRTIHALTTPVFDKVRAKIPPIGAMDLTPIVVLLVIMFIQRGILPSIQMFAMGLM